MVMVATGVLKVSWDNKSVMVLQGIVQWTSEASTLLCTLSEWDRAAMLMPAQCNDLRE